MLTAQENAYISEAGPGTPMGNLWRRFWIPALLATELPSPDCPPVRLRLLGEDLVAFKDSDGNIGMIDSHCPHRLADMFFGRNEECGLRCVYHGWKFDINGECVDMPNEPAESNFKSKIRTTAYPCQEWGGLIWAYMGPADRTPELPQLEWARVPDTHRHIGKIQVDCNYLQAVEGDIDNSHVSFLHSLLDPTKNITGSLRLIGAQNYYSQDKAPRFTVKSTDYGIMIGARRNADPEHFHWHITHWLIPGYAIVGSPGRDGTTICNVRVPRDDGTSWFYRVAWNPVRPLNEHELFDVRESGVIFPEMIPGTFLPKENRDNDYMIDRALQRSYSYTGIKSATQQDRAVTETMGMIVDRSKEHLGTSDTAIIAMRRSLRNAAANLEMGIEPGAAMNGDAYRVRSTGVLLPRDVPFDEGAKELVVARA